jgi:hypothetical protein
MGTMDSWDWALLALVGYVAVVSLTRLMIGRRDEMIGRFRKEMAEEKERQKKADQKQAEQEKLARRRAG